MREIKFRGYYEGDNNFPPGWVYGSYIKERDGAVSIYSINDNGLSMCFSVVLESVGQYTGLKDKNGKEIFEGDAVSYGLMDHNGDTYINTEVIRFGNESCWFEFDFPATHCEVVGNIHENPELLGGE